MNTCSITISPRGDIPEDWMDKLRKKFDSDKNIGNYIISEEFGANENQHFQIAVDTNRRTDNIRRMLISLLDPVFSDDDEKRQWLDVKKSNDMKYTFGYCMKENGNKRSNLDQDTRDNYYNHYKKIKESRKPLNWECKSINQLLTYCKEFAIKHDLMVHNNGIKLRSIIVILVNEGYIPFSLGRKIRKDDEIFWDDIVNMHRADGFGDKTMKKRIEQFNHLI